MCGGCLCGCCGIIIGLGRRCRGAFRSIRARLGRRNVRHVDDERHRGTPNTCGCLDDGPPSSEQTVRHEQFFTGEMTATTSEPESKSTFQRDGKYRSASQSPSLSRQEDSTSTLELIVSSEKTSSSQPPSGSSQQDSSNLEPIVSSEETSLSQSPSRSSQQDSSTLEAIVSSERTSSSQPPSGSSQQDSSTLEPIVSSEETSSSQSPSRSSQQDSSTLEPIVSAERTSSSQPPSASSQQDSSSTIEHCEVLIMNQEVVSHLKKTSVFDDKTRTLIMKAYECYKKDRQVNQSNRESATYGESSTSRESESSRESTSSNKSATSRKSTSSRESTSTRESAASREPSTSRESGTSRNPATYRESASSSINPTRENGRETLVSRSSVVAEDAFISSYDEQLSSHSYTMVRRRYQASPMDRSLMRLIELRSLPNLWRLLHICRRCPHVFKHLPYRLFIKGIHPSIIKKKRTEESSSKNKSYTPSPLSYNHPGSHSSVALS